MQVTNDGEVKAVSTNVMGIKFYDARQDLHSMMHVTFRREYDNIHDNAIVVLTKS